MVDVAAYDIPTLLLGYIAMLREVRGILHSGWGLPLLNQLMRNWLFGETECWRELFQAGELSYFSGFSPDESYLLPFFLHFGERWVLRPELQLVGGR